MVSLYTNNSYHINLYCNLSLILIWTIFSQFKVVVIFIIDFKSWLDSSNSNRHPLSTDLKSCGSVFFILWSSSFRVNSFIFDSLSADCRVSSLLTASRFSRVFCKEFWIWRRVSMSSSTPLWHKFEALVMTWSSSFLLSLSRWNVKQKLDSARYFNEKTHLLFFEFNTFISFFICAV